MGGNSGFSIPAQLGGSHIGSLEGISAIFAQYEDFVDGRLIQPPDNTAVITSQISKTRYVGGEQHGRRGNLHEIDRLSLSHLGLLDIHQDHDNNSNNTGRPPNLAQGVLVPLVPLLFSLWPSSRGLLQDHLRPAMARVDTV